MFKRVKVEKKKTSERLFGDDMLRDSLTEEGSFKMRMGAKIQIRELAEVNAETPGVLTASDRRLIFSTPETQTPEKTSEVADIPLDRSMHYHVHPDDHARLKRIVQEISGVLNLLKPIQVKHVDQKGLFLDAHVFSLGGDMVETLEKHEEIRGANVHASESHLVIRLDLDTPPKPKT